MLLTLPVHEDLLAAASEPRVVVSTSSPILGVPVPLLYPLPVAFPLPRPVPIPLPLPQPTAPSSTTSGLANIRPLIGICPQFDILWNTLTAKVRAPFDNRLLPSSDCEHAVGADKLKPLVWQEHLQIFCAIKGVPQDSVDVQSLTLLEEVRLSDVADKFAGTFSGGMKRRLSVALSMVGNPSCLFLDEPTTGMDPISRRHVWDVIERAKQDCCIVLTTHSMEEADILGDRVGIMAKGQLRCLGTPMHLKSKFGSGMARCWMNCDPCGPLPTPKLL